MSLITLIVESPDVVQVFFYGPLSARVAVVSAFNAEPFDLDPSPPQELPEDGKEESEQPAG